MCRTLRSSWYKCCTEGTMALKRWIVYVSTDTMTESQRQLLTFPLTSYATEGHIQREYYATYMQVNCLGDIPLNPQDYGFTTESECLVPKRCHRNLPDEVSLKCNCVKCATRSSPCRERNGRCCIFCKCQANSQCKKCKIPNGITITK